MKPHARFVTVAGVLIAGALLMACTMIGHERVAGWPALLIVEHYVSEFELRERCVPYVGFGMSPQACAEIHLTARTCHAWFSNDFPPPRAIVEHERLHCEGYDHVGSSHLQRLLSGFLQAEESSASAGASQEER